jgi:hypothetical protein
MLIITLQLFPESFHLFLNFPLIHTDISVRHISQHKNRIINIRSYIPVAAMKQSCLTSNSIKPTKGQSHPITGLDRPTGFQKVEAPRF